MYNNGMPPNFPTNQKFLLNNLPTTVAPVLMDYANCLISPGDRVGGLYLGDMVSARKPEVLTQFNIKAILSCDQKSKFDPNGPYKGVEDHKVLPAEDFLDYDISQHFQESFEFIDRNLLAGRNTLIHCHAGKSRSVTIAIAYLMKKFNWTVNKAYTEVKKRRPRAKPNDAFVGQLKNYHKKLFPDIDENTVAEGEMQLEVQGLLIRPLTREGMFTTPQKTRLETLPNTAQKVEPVRDPRQWSAPIQSPYGMYNPYVQPYMNPNVPNVPNLNVPNISNVRTNLFQSAQRPNEPLGMVYTQPNQYRGSMAQSYNPYGGRPSLW